MILIGAHDTTIRVCTRGDRHVVGRCQTTHRCSTGHGQGCGDIHGSRRDLEPNMIRRLLYLPEPPDPTIFDEGTCIAPA